MHLSSPTTKDAFVYLGSTTVEPGSAMALGTPITLDGPRSPHENSVNYQDGQWDALGGAMSHVTVGTRYHVTEGERTQENRSHWENRELTNAREETKKTCGGGQADAW